MVVIIDWLTKEGNYNRRREGDRQKGMTKLGIASEISQLIKDKGITVERQVLVIHIKINRLEQHFRTATEENKHAGKRGGDEDGGFTGGDGTQTPLHESGPAMSTSAAVEGRCISSRHR